MTPLASLAQAWPAKQAIKLAAVAAEAPDGYTFAVVFDSHGVNPSLIPGLPFDSKKDLSPVVLIGTAPMVLGTPAGSEFKTLADVVAGHMPLAIGSAFLLKPFIDGKRLRPLAVTTTKRSPDLPVVAPVFIERQMDVWGKLVKDNNIKAD